MSKKDKRREFGSGWRPPEKHDSIRSEEVDPEARVAERHAANTKQLGARCVGTLTWHVQPGDAFTRGQVLYDIDPGNKALQEMVAGFNGVVQELRVDSGAVVQHGQVVGVVTIKP